ANVIEDWPDPDRVVLYRSILGVPVYCFPHLNEEMKSAYVRYQARTDKSWPLHIDASWESLPHLDPEERRREKAAEAAQRALGVLSMALGAARGAIVADGGFALALETGQKLPLAESLTAAAERLLALEQ